jgi:hypothetical protein
MNTDFWDFLIRVQNLVSIVKNFYLQGFQLVSNQQSAWASQGLILF